MKDNLVRNKSLDFSVQIVELYRYLAQENREYVLSKQILKSGTSIGANINEAIQAQSKADFISKMSVALKEAYETLYWLDVLIRANNITPEQYQKYSVPCNELVSILVSIVKTSKTNA